MAVKLNQAQKALIEQNDQNTSDIALSVQNLVISFKTDNGKVQAVRGVSFDLHKGETLCIVGESGSGKSVTSKAIMGILSANALVEGGQIVYEGEDLLKVSEEEFHRIRGHKIGMIFQDPLSSLNPIVKIGKQIIETMMINSNQLTNYYKELIAPELTAYKNEKVIRNVAIDNANIKLNNLIADQKKERKPLEDEIADIKRNKGDASSKQQELDALKAKQAPILAKAQEEAKAAIEAAKAHYKEVAPGLKEKLKARKVTAKQETKKHAEELAKEYEAKKAELLKKSQEIENGLSSSEKARIAELEEQIKKIKQTYKWRLIGSYFLNKHKQKLRAEEAAKLAPLQKERDELAKDLDAIKRELEAADEEYHFQIKITHAMARKKALKVMREVGIPQPEARFKQYPFQFSGGMRQRIVIAIALIAEPDILICDEPTTALDVTIQAQILELINQLKAAHNMSVIFITHDLGVVANMADRVAVMYAGKIIEVGTDKEVFFDPRHPYTWALLSSIPDIDSKEKLEAIPGTPPDMIYPPEGDAFAERNKYALGIDFKYQPPLFDVSPTHKVASWLEYEGAPNVEPPRIVSERIYKALKDEEAKLKNENK